MFYRFTAFLQRLLYGRCGFDSLNKFIFAIYVALMAVNLFFHSRVIYFFIWVLFILLLLRMFSKNLGARQRENNRFMHLFRRFQQKQQQKNQRRADTTHVYKKCPHCKATIRLPRKKGKHRVDCPKCRKEFKVRILK